MPRCLKLTAAHPDSQVNSACFNTYQNRADESPGHFRSYDAIPNIVTIIGW